MTYKEAKDFIKDNWKELQPRTVNSKPAHSIIKSFVAPKQIDINNLFTVSTIIDDEHLPNDEILKQMGLFVDDLDVYLEFKTRGDIYILSYDDYKSIDWLSGDIGSGKLP